MKRDILAGEEARIEKRKLAGRTILSQCGMRDVAVVYYERKTPLQMLLLAERKQN